MLLLNLLLMSFHGHLKVIPFVVVEVPDVLQLILVLLFLLCLVLSNGLLEVVNRAFLRNVSLQGLVEHVFDFFE